jgi:LacI family transcriptional regulator
MLRSCDPKMTSKVKRRPRAFRSLHKQGRARPAPTIDDVAAVAGVAPMTVSRVVNRQTNVRQEKRDAVNAAIAKLQYTPNLAARILACGEPVRLGMLFSTLSAAFLSELLIGTLDQASSTHAQVVIEQSNGQKDEHEAVRELLATGVDGIILAPPLCDSMRVHAAIKKAGALAVAIASASPCAGLLAVSIDDRAAAFSMTRHILSLGHTRIGFITGNPDQSASALRLSGYETALAEANIAVDGSLIQQGRFTYRSGLNAAEQLLNLAKPPTAIFASNDDMGAATIAVAHRRHLKVPEDLTVCGFDDTALSRSISPELTTIRQPIADMSRAAVVLLLNAIRARREGRAVDIKSVLLDFTLVHRESDGPYPINRAKVRQAWM